MKITADIAIEKPKSEVWAAITDIENSSKMISNIIGLKILHRPDAGLVGLKWQETRIMFGKEASEVMWITEAVDNEYYCTRAENHGCVYLSQLALSESGGNTLLTMSFCGQAQTMTAKILSICTGIFVKSSVKNLLRQDLQDIKAYVEQD